MLLLIPTLLCAAAYSLRSQPRHQAKPRLVLPRRWLRRRHSLIVTLPHRELHRITRTRKLVPPSLQACRGVFQDCLYCVLAKRSTRISSSVTGSGGLFGKISCAMQLWTHTASSASRTLQLHACRSRLNSSQAPILWVTSLTWRRSIQYGLVHYRSYLRA